MDIRNSPRFKTGVAAEHRIKQMLEERGWFVKRSEREDRKSPVATRLWEANIEPDLDAWKSGTSCWVEVKSHAHAHKSPIQKSLTHGITHRHYLHYRKMQKESGRPVFLAILERSTGDVLCRSLDHLTDFYHGHVDVGPAYNDQWGEHHESQVYFRREYFHVLFSVHDPHVDGSPAVFKAPGPAVQCAETMGEQVVSLPRIKAMGCRPKEMTEQKQGVLFDEAFFR